MCMLLPVDVALVGSTQPELPRLGRSSRGCERQDWVIACIKRDQRERKKLRVGMVGTLVKTFKELGPSPWE